jgi:hypothetical protein
MIYTFTTIETNLIGSSGVTLKEQNTQDGMSMLLGSLGSTSYTVSRICVWADNPNQLENIIFIDDIDANGNVVSVPMIPYLDSKQLQNQCCFDLSGYMLTVNSKIGYQIKGETTLRLSFTVETSKALSTGIQIQEITGVNEIKDVREKLGQTEPEEKSGWNEIKPSTGKEPGEKTQGKSDNVVMTQESLQQEITQAWPSEKLEDLYAPESSPIYTDKQEGMDKVVEKYEEKAPVQEKINLITKHSYNSNAILILIGGAIGIWLLSGKPNVIKSITKQ